MAKEKILVVDDEEDILELITFNLFREGYKVFTADNGEKAIKIAKSEIPDMIILDLMLPGIDGLEVARVLKSRDNTKAIPIIMLSAKGDESDIVSGLELGADDYITKPFSPKILIARIRAVLRRKSDEISSENTPLHVHVFVIDPHRREVMVDENPVELTYTEFEVLYFLARRPGWVFTRTQIVDAAKGENYAVTDRSVDVQIVGLRKKLGDAGKFIETVRGVGYRFRERS
jgi:two-component system, OmpR family, alkaline phosphatase synthesis response regulator PhoP